MEYEELKIPGCYLIKPNVFEDKRGRFVKTYHEEAIKELGIEFDFKEEYYSFSKKGVIRGMHFQTPPCDHVKLVCCPKGAVFDSFVDLRKGSPTYLHTASLELTESNCNVLILDKGIAHGFCALTDDAMMIYKTSTVYSPDNDSGIAWDSCGINWPDSKQIELISDRDNGFVKLTDFDSPFSY